MALPQYTAERRHEIAAALGIDEQYLYQIVRGLKTASPALAMRLHMIDPKARLKDLRPDDWRLIWPSVRETRPFAVAAPEPVKAEG